LMHLKKGRTHTRTHAHTHTHTHTHTHIHKILKRGISKSYGIFMIHQRGTCLFTGMNGRALLSKHLLMLWASWIRYWYATSIQLRACHKHVDLRFSPIPIASWHSGIYAQHIRTLRTETAEETQTKLAAIFFLLLAGEPCWKNFLCRDHRGPSGRGIAPFEITGILSRRLCQQRKMTLSSGHISK
jgi:hypothetical protein